MSRRARYVGPFDEVRVAWPPGETVGQESVTVKRDHWLPEEIEKDDGTRVPVPASLRDELLQGDDWTEVAQSTSKAASSGKKES